MPGMLSQVVTLIRESEYEASDVFPGLGPNIRHPLSVFSFPPPGPAGPVPRLRRYYEGATTSCCPSRRTSFPSLGDTSGVHSLCSLPGGRVHRQGLELVTRYLRPGSRRGGNRSSQVPGEPQSSVCHVPNRRRQDCLHQTIKCSSVAPGHQKARAPTKGLSTLHSMAFGLAAYASQCGLLQHHARLASSCWSGSTGRAFHPQGSSERFQICKLHFIPLSQTFLAQAMSPKRRNRTARNCNGQPSTKHTHALSAIGARRRSTKICVGVFADG
jgi:hypothetical protein